MRLFLRKEDEYKKLLKTPATCLATGEPDLLVHAGEAIGNSEAIRRIHNSFAAPESIVSEESPEAKDSDDLFHFVRSLLYPIQTCWIAQ